jgi:aminopeptidase N
MFANTFVKCKASIFLLTITATTLFAQTSAPQTAKHPSRGDVLRGEYGRYRANNDLLFYDLDIRVDPEKKFVSGKNTIRFKMLKDDTRIQLDLYDNLKIDKILFQRSEGSGQRSSKRDQRSEKNATELKYERDSGAVLVDFPETLKAGRSYTIDFYYSGTPQTIGRFGGFTFGKDPMGRPWIFTACEGEGASIWWPNKDQWKDEVESMNIRVAVPNGLSDVSNGKFLGKTDLGDGYTRWDWLVQYPINNYNVSLNIGNYVHWDERLGDLSLDFYALPEDLDKAKTQFAQAKGMLQAFQHYFGDYPFKKDGYKLVQAPYSGMEHQSAVTYGNRFKNGYLDATGPASAFQRGSISSSFTRADTSGSATASPPPTAPTCGYTKDGPPTSSVFTSSSGTGKTTV